jgi:hypothetical protein
LRRQSQILKLSSGGGLHEQWSHFHF